MKAVFVLVALFAAAWGRNCFEHLLEVNQKPLLGQMVPVCKDDGSYHQKQYIGSTCFCADQNGKAIGDFVTPIYKCAEVTCNCARDRHEYQKLGIVGRMFRCDERGNYEKVQCHGSVCFCANELGASAEGSQKVHVSQIHTLQC